MWILTQNRKLASPRHCATAADYLTANTLSADQKLIRSCSLCSHALSSLLHLYFSKCYHVMCLEALSPITVQVSTAVILENLGVPDSTFSAALTGDGHLCWSCGLQILEAFTPLHPLGLPWWDFSCLSLDQLRSDSGSFLWMTSDTGNSRWLTAAASTSEWTLVEIKGSLHSNTEPYCPAQVVYRNFNF